MRKLLKTFILLAFCFPGQINLYLDHYKYAHPDHFVVNRAKELKESLLKSL